MKRLMMISLMVLALAAAVMAVDDAPAKQEEEAAKVEKVEKAEKVEQVKEEAKEIKVVEVKEPEIVTTESGLRYQDLVPGQGVEATDKMHVDCHYTLWFADSTGLVKGKRMQSSKDRGQSFQCQIGVGLIPGWSEGMIGMKEGGVRRLYVPWKLGYGADGHSSGTIPGKQNLIFEIEFIKSLDKK